MKAYDASYFDVEVCRPFLHEGSDKGIVLLHGFGGSVSHMRPLGDALAALGYTVMGINLPGHATTEADMATTGWQQWLEAARQAVLALKARCTTVVVGGLSMGGVLSLLLAERGLPDACIAISAPMFTRNRFIRFAKLAAPLYPRVTNASPNKRHKQLDAAYDYGYSGFPTSKAADLNRLIRMARTGLGHIVCPLLAIQSTGDRVIWAGSADCIINGCNSAQKRKLILNDVPHVCTISRELPTIVSSVDALLKAL